MASSEGNYHRRGPYFDGTNFASWKYKMKMHILGYNPAEGVLDKGSSDSRTISFGRIVGL